MAVGKIGGMLAVLGVNTAAWNSGLTKAQKRWNTFGASMQVAGFRMAAVLTTALIGIGGAVIKFGANWERAFAGVKKTMEIVGPDAEKQLKLIEEGLLQISKIAPHTTTEIAKFAQIGARMGIGAENILDFAQTISMLSVAIEDLDPEETAFGLAQLVKVTGASEKDFGRLGSVLARLGDNFATTEQKILNFARRISGLAAVSGMTAQDTMGIAAAFAQVRPQVESAATAVSKGISQIVESVASGEGRLKAFALVSGMTAEQFQKQWRDDAALTFAKVMDGLAASGDRGIVVLKALGLSNERAKQTMLAMSQSTGELARGIRLARDEFILNEKLTREYATVMETAKERAKVLLGQLQLLAIKGYQGLSDVITKFMVVALGAIELLEAAVDWFINLDTATRSSIISWGLLLAAIGPVLIIVGGVITVLVSLSTVIAPLIALIGVFVASVGVLNGRMIDMFDVMLFAGDVIRLTTMALHGLQGAFDVLKIGAATLGVALLEVFNLMAVGPFGKKPKWMEDSIQYFADMALAGIDSLDEQRAALRDLHIEMNVAGVEAETMRAKFAKGGDVWKDMEFKAKIALDKIKAQLADLADKKDDALGTKPGEAGFVGALPLTEAQLKKLADAAKKRAAEIKKYFREALRETEEFIKDFSVSGISAFAAMSLPKEQQDILKNLLGLTPGGITAAAEEFKATIGFLFSQLGGHLEGPLRNEVINKMAQFWQDLIAAGQTGAAKQMADMAEDMGIDRNLIIGYDPDAFVGPLQDVEAVTAKTLSFKDALDSVTDAFRVLGITSSSTLGRILGGLAVGAEAGQRFAKAIESMRNESGGLDFNAQGLLGAGMAGLGAGAAVVGATGSGSRTERVAGGAMTGAAAGAQIGGPIGALIGGIGGAIVGALRDRKLLNIMSDVGRDWGVEISEELGKAIEDTMKTLDLGQFESTLLHFSDILAEAGGLGTENLEQFTGKFNDLLNAVANGSIEMEAGLKAINEGFADMVEGLQGMGTAGSIAIGKLVNRMGELGLETQSLKDHLKEQGTALVSALEPALEWIASLDDLTSAEAEAFQGVIVTAFGGAVAATGSFIEAVRMLGDTFGEALRNIMDVLGPDGANIIGPIASIYNMISNNQEAFDALHGIISSLDAMAQMGILTAESLTAMGEGVRVTFERILAETDNLKGTIKATWPELLKLFHTYQEMGMKVPKWLQDVIDKGEGMGLSMEMPPTVLSVLEEVLAVLKAIGIELGAITTGAGDAGGAIGDIPSPGGSGSNGGDGGRGDNQEFAKGGIIEPSAGGELVRVGEGGEREFIVPESKLSYFVGAVGGGGVSIGDIYYNIDNTGGDIESLKEALEANTEDLTGTILREINIQGGISNG